MQIITATEVCDVLGTEVSGALQMMVDGANARAARVAPCLAADASEDMLAEARLILLGAIKRWSEAGSGSFQSMTAGPFGVQTDSRQRSGYALWPSEIEALQDLCRNAGSAGGAYMVDMTPDRGATMADRPDLWFQWVQPVPPGAP